MSIRWMSAAFAMACALGACGKDEGKSGQPSASEGDKILTELAGHRDAVCGCPDQECAMKAGEAAGAFEVEVKSKFTNPTDEQRERFQAIAGEIKECLRKY